MWTCGAFFSFFFALNGCAGAGEDGEEEIMDNEWGNGERKRSRMNANIMVIGLIIHY